jgi:hypothetical protein
MVGISNHNRNPDDKKYGPIKENELNGLVNKSVLLNIIGFKQLEYSVVMVDQENKKIFFKDDKDDIEGRNYNVENGYVKIGDNFLLGEVGVLGGRKRKRTKRRKRKHSMKRGLTVRSH